MKRRIASVILAVLLALSVPQGGLVKAEVMNEAGELVILNPNMIESMDDFGKESNSIVFAENEKEMIALIQNIR